ncbi:MAG TPA: hypothetical protein PLP17_15605, partial [Oligoflexia bacterium]|nr:hypothetical protein [Oligoflexia bacterium]
MTSKAALVLILLAGAPGSLLAQALTDEPADSKPLPAAAEDAEGTDPGPLTTSGVYFGHILALDVDAKAVFIKPADSGFSRRSFYFDRKTLFTA